LGEFLQTHLVTLLPTVKHGFYNKKSKRIIFFSDQCDGQRPVLQREFPPRGELWSLGVGFPDFSWYVIPKLEKNVPNGHKMSQMSIKYINIFQSKALKYLPKLGFLV
jgi:hypothetical protein